MSRSETSPKTTVLGEREHRVLQALAERLFPRDPRFPQSGADIDFKPPVDRHVAATGPTVSRNIKRAILAFERGAHLSRFSLKPFTKLPPEEQDKYIRAWAESGFYPRRALFNALKALVTLVYASEKSVERAVGYEVPTEPG